MDRFVMTASSISVSELKSNRKYFSVSMRMFSTRANLNKCAVTEAFIDDIIANKSDYVCMPLCADVSKLKRKDYRGLTHMQDRTTGTFLAEEIGSFYDFEKVSDEYGVSLIGYARINKRNQLVCEAIQEMYDNNALNFSFEISAGAVSIVDGISIVDVNEANELTAMAVVSVPAYPESKALDLVAEADDMARFYEHASMLISEVDLETVKCRFHKLLYEVLGDGVYALNVLLFCHDCVILYAFETGMTYKVEYKMDNDDLLITDIYTVDYVRSKGSEEEMFAENMNTEAEAVVEVAEAVAEVEEAIAEVETEVEVEVAEEVIEAEVQVETAEEIVEDVIAEDQEEDKVEDPVQEVEEDKEDEELAELRKRVAELEAENETLSQYKAEIEKIEEEKRIAEVESKKEKLRKYASEEGLSIEEPVIAEAIEALDYEAIVAEVTANKEKAKTEKKDETYVASYTDIGTKGISYLFKSR